MVARRAHSWTICTCACSLFILYVYTLYEMCCLRYALKKRTGYIHNDDGYSGLLRYVSGIYMGRNFSVRMKSAPSFDGDGKIVAITKVYR